MLSVASTGIVRTPEGKDVAESPSLPGRAPDIRVAVSAVVQTPSQTIVPDGGPQWHSLFGYE